MHKILIILIIILIYLNPSYAEDSNNLILPCKLTKQEITDGIRDCGHRKNYTSSNIVIGNNNKTINFNGQLDDFTIIPPYKEDYDNLNESINLTSFTITMEFQINKMVLFSTKNTSITTADCDIPIISEHYYNLTGKIENGIKNITCQEINASEYQNITFNGIINEIKIFDKPELSLWEKICKYIFGN